MRAGRRSETRHSEPSRPHRPSSRLSRQPKRSQSVAKAPWPNAGRYSLASRLGFVAAFVTILAVTVDPALRVTRIYFGVDPTGQRLGAIEPWAPGKKPRRFATVGPAANLTAPANQSSDSTDMSVAQADSQPLRLPGLLGRLFGDAGEQQPGIHWTPAVALRNVANLAFAARKGTEPAPSLAHEAFEVAQWANQSSAAAAIQLMSTRFAPEIVRSRKGDAAIPRLVHAVQDI